MIGKRPADADFEYARRKAFWNKLFAFLRGRPNRLISWEQARRKLGVRGEIYQGMHAIPVEKVVGSVGRYQDFDRAFLPTKDSIARRWLSIARAYYEAVNLPPVQLYKVGDVYFVLDGHHRISVARERGIHYVDAKVIEVTPRVPVTDHLDAEELEIKGEYVRFLERTRLDLLRPEQRIEFTIAGGYERLLEHIAVQRYAMSQENGQPISADEGVCEWYDGVYSPLVDIIREKGILTDFPNRTEADLYLWIMDHQHYLREQCGPGVILERVAEHFADRHTRHPVKRVVNAVREWVSDSACEWVTPDKVDAGDATEVTPH